MALQESLGVLVEFGVFNEEAVDRLASMVKAVQSLTNGAVITTLAAKRGRGRPAGSGKAPSGSSGKPRGRRGKFNITKEELKKLYIDQGMTGKAIAEKYGVSSVTVAQRAMKMGLSKRKK